jgi:hypothetical protein
MTHIKSISPARPDNIQPYLLDCNHRNAWRAKKKKENKIMNISVNTKLNIDMENLNMNTIEGGVGEYMNTAVAINHQERNMEKWLVCPDLENWMFVHIEHSFQRKMFVYSGMVMCETCWSKFKRFGLSESMIMSMSDKSDSFLKNHVLGSESEIKDRTVCTHLLDRDNLERYLVEGDPLVWQNGVLLCIDCAVDKALERKFRHETLNVPEFKQKIIDPILQINEEYVLN